MNKNIINPEYIKFLEQLKERVASSRYRAALSANKELILLYHSIGTEILRSQESHGWGAKIIDQLSNDLKSEFPEMKGFSLRNLKYMRKFAREYAKTEFVQQVAAQLPWFHIVTILDKVQGKKAQEFYMQKTIEHGWSRNILNIQIELNLHKRQGQAITNFKNRLAPLQSDLVHNTLKDPYIFDFLSLGKEASEREIEKALVTHIEKFLLELGAGFAFVGRQYHLEVDGEDFYLDMLFYHLKLKCYIIIELKAGKFKPEYVGKLNFYLSAVDDILRDKYDQPSIGLILCKDKGGKIKGEYALKDVNKPIGLSEYKIVESIPENLKTALPSIEELEAELSRHIDKSEVNEK